MKRKCSILVLIVLLACTLAGCVTEGTREDIIACLEKEGVIKEDWEFLYTVSKTEDMLPVVVYFYVYDTGEGLCAVKINMRNSDGSYPVYIGDNVEVEERQWQNEEGKTVTGREVTRFNMRGDYRLAYKKILWFNRMEIMEVKEY